jgi:hypothetical protein
LNGSIYRGLDLQKHTSRSNPYYVEKPTPNAIARVNDCTVRSPTLNIDI